MMIIYSRLQCPNCEIAKVAAMVRGIKFTEALLDTPEKIEQFKKDYPKAKSVPYVISESGDVIGGLTAFKKWLHERD